MCEKTFDFKSSPWSVFPCVPFPTNEKVIFRIYPLFQVKSWTQTDPFLWFIKRILQKDYSDSEVTVLKRSPKIEWSNGVKSKKKRIISSQITQKELKQERSFENIFQLIQFFWVKMAPLLNKPYINEVTLSKPNQSQKSC